MIEEDLGTAWQVVYTDQRAVPFVVDDRIYEVKSTYILQPGQFYALVVLLACCAFLLLTLALHLAPTAAACGCRGTAQGRAGACRRTRPCEAQG